MATPQRNSTKKQGADNDVHSPINEEADVSPAKTDHKIKGLDVNCRQEVLLCNASQERKPVK